MTAYWLLVAHLVGDYIIQTDWMANTKTTRSWPAAVHAATYTLPFMLLFGVMWQPLLLIAGTHFVIDRWRLARHLIWFRNLMSPAEWRKPWVDCQSTGYHKDKPAWMTVWLMIIADNTLHLIINGVAWELWGVPW